MAAMAVAGAPSPRRLMKSHVYLLAHRNGKRFKIGKANDIIERARCFGLRELDWASSVGLVLRSTDEALRLERILLRTFADWRLTAEEVLDDDGAQNGATEWMRSECRNRVEAFLQHIEDVIPHSRICGDSLNCQVNSLIEPVLQAKVERERRGHEKRERDALRATLRRAQALASRAALEAAMSKARDNFWRELARHAGNGSIVGMALEDYGWNLILLDEKVGEHLWQAEIQDTKFSWPGGAGGLVDSVAEYEVGDARVSMVSLGSCLYEYWPSRDLAEGVLGRVVSFLRSLLIVDCGQLKSTLWEGVWDGEDEWLAQKHGRVVQAFVDDHLPTLQQRRAARLSAVLF